MSNIGNKEVFGRNLSYYLERSGKTQKELSELVGVAPSTFNAWLQGNRYPRIDKIEIMADYFGIQKSDLIEDKSIKPDPFTVPNLFQIHAKRFPLLGDIACGEPTLADEHVELYVMAGAGLQADFCLRAKGDSMTGARIYDGDIVFIRKQDTVNDGEIAAVLIDGEATLKRVYYDREANVLTLFAENPQFKTMRFSGELLNHVRILGKAVAFQSDIR